MKLLLFSDLHRDRRAAKRLVARSAEVDVVVGAGDLATTRRGLPEMVDVLRAIETPTVLVAGNSETDGELRAACADWPAARPLHGASSTIGGVEFFGLGGAVPVTPFGDWSFDLTEEEAERLLAGAPEGCVLVSHSPPHGHVDIDSSGRHLGSRAVLETIETKRPRLVVCGHIHGSWGERARLGDTLVVNAGPEGTLIEIDR